MSLCLECKFIENKDAPNACLWMSSLRFRTCFLIEIKGYAINWGHVPNLVVYTSNSRSTSYEAEVCEEGDSQYIFLLWDLQRWPYMKLWTRKWMWNVSLAFSPYLFRTLC